MSDGQVQSGRAALAVVTALAPERAASRASRVWFCSHCGVKPPAAVAARTNTRVCGTCGLGVLLEAPVDAAPPDGGAFMVLDRSLSVCAVSAAAERLLATCDTDAVNHHVTELLVPADTECRRPSNFAAAVTWAATGDETPRTVTVRPANVFGVRLTARIASCSPPRAALLVFEGPAR